MDQTHLGSMLLHCYFLYFMRDYCNGNDAILMPLHTHTHTRINTGLMAVNQLQWWDQDSKGKTPGLKTKTLSPKTKTVTFRLQDENKTVTLLMFKTDEQTQW